MRKRFLLFFMILIPLFLLSQSRILVNPSFETGFFNTPTTWNPVASQAAANPEMDGWYSTHPTYSGVEFPIEVWKSGFQGVAAQDGVHLVEMNVSQLSRTYQFIYLVSGETFDFEIYHRKRMDEAIEETIEFNIYSQDGNTKEEIIGTHTASGNEWNQFAGSFTFAGADGVYQLGLEAITPINSGNLLDNITIGLDPFTEFYQSTRTANEGESPFFIPPHIIVNGKVSNASTITFSVDESSTAVEGEDYDFTPLTINVPAGYYGTVDSIPLGLTLIDNDLLQEDRTLIINIDNVTGDLNNVDSNGDGYKGTLTITIQDNDADLPAITSLAMALDVPYPGVFDFDINGATFETYVNSNGWVLVASETGEIVNANLPQEILLTGWDKGILAEDVLASLIGIEKLRFSTTGNSMDVTTTNATLTSRINTFTTLHRGLDDNELNDSWTGVGANNLGVNATCNTGLPTTLDANIFHLCGVNGTHWIPNNAKRSEVGNQNNDPDVSFYLWVGARSTITWTGGSNNTDWNDPGNWDSGVPGKDDNVVIPTSPSSGNSVFPVIGNSVEARCFDLTIESGASLEIESGGELIME